MYLKIEKKKKKHIKIPNGFGHFVCEFEYIKFNNTS